MLNGMRRSAMALGALLPLAAPLAAQVAAQGARGHCSAGVAFGVTSYQCSNCSIAYTRHDTVGRTVYTFGAELVVLKIAPESQLRVGDVIVAVNGNPITTRAGADQFVYPLAGSKSVITVRRDGANVEIGPMAPSDIQCESTYYDFEVSKVAAGRDSVRTRIGVTYDTLIARGGAGGRGGVGSGMGAAGGRGGRGGGVAGGMMLDSALRARLEKGTFCTIGPLPAQRGTVGSDSTRPPLRLRTCFDSVTGTPRLSETVSSVQILPMPLPVTGRAGGVYTNTAAASAPNAVSSFIDLRNFGLTLQCATPCTRARARDGTQYWKFDGYPALNAPTKDGLAAKAGLREGDVLISVNGLSPLTEEGALLLARYARELTLTLEISRAGKREKFTLKL